METIQLTTQAVDVADWRRDEEFAEYPEGARDKTLLYCPLPKPYNFLKADHRYLFKRSSPRYPEQFWVEIIAYLLGIQMDILVPPAFVAYDSKQNQCGALIEWFLKTPGKLSRETYIPGGDYCQQYIPNFDRKKGTQHSFETVSQIFNDLTQRYPSFNINWHDYWAKVFVFDALIGNTDRHQDNWGIIATQTYIDNQPPVSYEKMRISPVFDNGTSMGHEIFPNKFDLAKNQNRLEKYMSKGRHHMKWSLTDTDRINHCELLKKFIDKHPETRATIVDCLHKITYETLKNILDYLTSFDIPVKLTTERSEFMLKLLQFRHQRLLSELEK